MPFDPRHAVLRRWEDRWLVVDDGSREGTRIGGVALRAGSSRWLRPGIPLSIGQIELELRENGPGDLDASTDPNTRELALRMVAGTLRAMAAPEVTTLHVVEGADIGRALPLDLAGKKYVVGRAAGCALPLNDPDVSREHVQLVRDGARVTVTDLGAAGGTELGSTRLPKGAAVDWHPEMLLRVGRTVLAIELSSEVQRQQLEEAAPPTAPPVAEPDEEAGSDAQEAVSTPSEPDATSLEAAREGGAATAPVADVTTVENHATPPVARPKRRWMEVGLVVVVGAVIAASLVLLAWIFLTPT